MTGAAKQRERVAEAKLLIAFGLVVSAVMLFLIGTIFGLAAAVLAAVGFFGTTAGLIGVDALAEARRDR